MKFGVLISCIIVMLLFYSPNAFASWVMMPGDDGTCPRDFEIISVDTDYGEFDVCIPDQIPPDHEQLPVYRPPAQSGPRPGLPLEGPHFEGAL